MSPMMPIYKNVPAPAALVMVSTIDAEFEPVPFPTAVMVKDAAAGVLPASTLIHCAESTGRNGP